MWTGEREDDSLATQRFSSSGRAYTYRPPRWTGIPDFSPRCAVATGNPRIPVIPIAVSVPIAVGGLPAPGSVAGRGDVSVWRTCRNAVVPVNILHALFHADDFTAIVCAAILLPARIVAVKALLVTQG